MRRGPGALLALLLAAAPGCARAPVKWPHFRSALAGMRALSPGEGGVLSASALEGRVVLVSFMATWCAPCLMELPYLESLQREHAGAGLTVVMVGMDLEGELVLGPFAREYQLPFPLVLADERIRGGQTPFGAINVLPTTFLLGRDGSVLAAFQGLASQPELSAAVARAVATGL
ncbi:MAG TPA: TlpA disulfide reductase family protein [Myxococcales bacterium]|nr:TlpA disulfide reductase family protein [Myxococcales bacterium]